ncbi:hypothetical protein CVT26_007840 [Gymnopilus dilepis]|uniref:Major facilitator superfamily (MFS) profile domain-containing protein n=1 Tax=Gymnopilus dilepis TaxID=231916 RepID=A0A409WEJ2_9AGAR|nr:hypothetical protein CVT26_007840 [Gymnopilus dilepis]
MEHAKFYCEDVLYSDIILAELTINKRLLAADLGTFRSYASMYSGPYMPPAKMEKTLREKIRGVSLIFACGTALFADGYANGVIGSGTLVSQRWKDNIIDLLFQSTPVRNLKLPIRCFKLNQSPVLTRIYGADALSHHMYSRTLSSLAFFGEIVGMLSFGYMSDKIGRKFGMMAATGIVIVFSALSAASKGAHGSVNGLLSMLSAMRFLVGIGIGAEYPCGSVAASEQSSEPAISSTSRHRWVALATSMNPAFPQSSRIIFTFHQDSMIDFGFVIASFVPLVLFWMSTFSFGNHHLNAVWRLSLALAIVPSTAVFLWRLNMDEPVRYKTDSMKYARIPYMLVLRRYGVRLAAIAFIWFLYDFVAYPKDFQQFGLYSSIIIDRITGGSDDLVVVFGWNVIINLFNMPGTIGGALLLDRFGPKYVMITSLLLQAAIGFIMSGAYERLTGHIAAFAVRPGNCTILLAGKTSPTAVRGQFYGIAAAVGKLGAFVGTWAFPPIVDAFGGPSSTRGNTGPFWIGSGLAIISAIVTLLFIHPLDAEDIVKEDRSFREYLEAHGYDTSGMGLTEDRQVETVDMGDNEKDEYDEVVRNPL